MNKTYQRCVAAYDYMRQHSVIRTGSWLEGHDFSIEFLSSYEDQVEVFLGRVNDVGHAIGVSASSLQAQIFQALIACGCVYKLRNGMYALIRTPTESEFEKFRIRKTIGSTKSVREEVADQLQIIHRRIDEIESKLRELESHVGRRSATRASNTSRSRKYIQSR